MSGCLEVAQSPLPEEEMGPEEIALVAEIKRLKCQLESARKAVADTDFYKMTEHVVGLERLKFKVRKSLTGHLAKVTNARWAVDGQLLLSAAQDGKLIVWDTYTTNKVRMIALKTDWVLGCAFAPSMNFVSSGGLDNIIALFSLKTPEGTPAKLLRELSGHTGYISSLDYVEEQKLLSSSGDKTCRLWDVEQAKCITVFRGHANDVTSARCCDSERSLFVSVSVDFSCRAWDIRSGVCVQVFEGHKQDVNGLDFFPRGYAFATSSDDRSCRLWDLRADQAIALYIDDYIKCGSTSIGLSHSGRLLIAGYDDFNCHVWDVLREERVGIMSAHDGRVSSVSVNGVGSSIATASWDTMCYIWTAK